MNISITKELKQFVDQKVASGMYTSASEVIRESLRIMRAHENVQQSRINELNSAIELGLNQSKQGETTGADEADNRLLALIKTIENKQK